jgi:uncharacterized FlaG/YvyC family protein
MSSPARPTPDKRTNRPETASAPEAQAPQTAEAGELKRAVQELELRFNVNVEVGTDEQTGRQVVRVLSEDGERLLRQMPPEEAIRMAEKARKGALQNLLTSLV